MTTQQKVTKDDWYIVCEALEAWAEKLAGWAGMDSTPDSARQTFTSENYAVRDLLARLVNTKLREGDKWRRFGEYAD